jgi:hypothetical protein
VNHLGAHALQDAPHDVDGRVMPIEQRSGSDKAHLVLGAVVGQRLEFGRQIGHGENGVNREKAEQTWVTGE